MKADPETKAFGGNLEKMKRLAGRKRLKSEHTLALQIALLEAQQEAWEKSGLSDKALKPAFFTAYEDFLLGVGFKALWNNDKKSAIPTFTGYTFVQAVRYAAFGIDDSLADESVYMLCQGIRTGCKTDDAEVFNIQNASKCADLDVDLFEQEAWESPNDSKPSRSLPGASVPTAPSKRSVDRMLTEQHLRVNIRDSAYPISKILNITNIFNVFEEETGKQFLAGITDSSDLLPDGWRWLNRYVRAKCKEKFQKHFVKLAQPVIDEAPLLVRTDIDFLYTPKRAYTGSYSPYRHVAIVSEFDGVKTVKRKIPVIPTAATLKRVEEALKPKLVTSEIR